MFQRFVRTVVGVSFLFFSSLPSIADTAQPFSTLSGLPGETSSVAALLQPDKWTVVVIWAADCHVCNQEASTYSDFHLMHEDVDAQVLGLSIDGGKAVDDAKAFVEKHQVSFPNLIGDVNAVARFLYAESGQQFRATPTIMLYNPAKQLRAVQAGAVPPELIEKFMAEHS